MTMTTLTYKHPIPCHTCWWHECFCHWNKS